MATAGIKNLLWDIIAQNTNSDTLDWLGRQGDIQNITAFNAAFAMMPRKTGKNIITVTPAQKTELAELRPGFSVDNWTTDRLARVWLLVQGGEGTDSDKYFSTIETLFTSAEMNELVALYSALPVLPQPQLWVKRCAEGIRSNIGTVLEAIMYHNPYPAENLAEPAWNQMVMKAIFTEKELNLITGLNERANPELARILIDYAQERQAAGRNVIPALWQLAAKFTSEAQINKLKQQNSAAV